MKTFLEGRLESHRRILDLWWCVEPIEPTLYFPQLLRLRFLSISPPRLAFPGPSFVFLFSDKFFDC